MRVERDRPAFLWLATAELEELASQASTLLGGHRDLGEVAEAWMVEISSCGPDDRMVILSHLNTVKGDVDAAELAALLKAKGVA